MKYKIKFTGYAVLSDGEYWEDALEHRPDNPTVQDIAKDARDGWSPVGFIEHFGLEAWLQVEIEETDEDLHEASSLRPDKGITAVDNDPSVSPRRKAP